MNPKHLLKAQWVSRDGSVYADILENKVNPDFEVRYSTTPLIAANIGEKLADHIVRLHNMSLERIDCEKL